MEVFTAFAGELERSIAWGSGGFTTLRGAVARLQRNSPATEKQKICAISDSQRIRVSRVSFMEVFTAFAGELESSIAWGSGGLTTLGGAVARVQRKLSEQRSPGPHGR